jgi:DNA repair exonuclease SbcCD ATPase subunit
VLGSQDLGARSPSNVVTAGPWNARDGYIAETAVTIDRLTAKIERLERREEALKAQVAELVEHTQQSNRFQALAESLRNSREHKLEEALRVMKDLRSRIEAIEGPRSEYSGLLHRNLSVINQKLIELAAPARRDVAQVWQQRAVQAATFSFAVVLAAVVARLF